MARKLERRWPELKKKSQSTDDFDRTVALASAVGAIEIALTAVGVPRKGREGVQARIDKFWRLATPKQLPEINNIFTADDKTRDGKEGDNANPLLGILSMANLPEKIKVMRAIRCRNEAVHEHHVPNPEECKIHLGVLHKVWRELRRTFVTRQQASTLAAKFLEIELDTKAVKNVFLFGSLARGKRDPRDIDLLIFDNGELSFAATGYGEVDAILNYKSIDSPENRAANQCGWIDLVLIDGSRLGADKDYTLSIAKTHDDPLFLINISDGLLSYVPGTKRWSKERPPVFERLALLRRQLENENVVQEQK